MTHSLKLSAIAAIALLCGLVGAPAYAQVDLNGGWQSLEHEDWIERAPGPDIGDYTGLPLNDEGRARADAYQVSLQAMPERQCILYTAQYMVMGPQNLLVPFTTALHFKKEANGAKWDPTPCSARW